MFFRKKESDSSFDDFTKRAKKFSPFELEKYDEYADFLRENKRQAVQRRLGLRLVVAADTHGNSVLLRQRLSALLERAPEYDLCVLLGDISPCDLEVVSELVPKEKILGLLGNHDDFDLYSRRGIKNISGRKVECKGVTFAGIEGSFRYKDGNFPSFTQYESLKRFKNLTEADVLFSHDCMFRKGNTDAAHAGLIGITRFVYKYAPLWHIHGHLHKSYSENYDNGTVEKCVYFCEYVEI